MLAIIRTRFLLVVLSFAFATAMALPGITAVPQAQAVEEPLIAQATVMETQSMHRLYNPNSGEHFYTTSEIERDYLIGVGWNYEDRGLTAPFSGDPVYRLYNSYAGEHHYTLESYERDFLVEIGWSDEGIGWYSDVNEAVPLYRVYNPNAFSNNHHYTTSPVERDYLLDLGWFDEGEGWYGVNPDNPPVQYDYEIKELSAFGAYTDSDIALYVRTDNPEDNFSIACDTAHVNGVSTAYYDDVHIRDTDNVRYQMQPLASGNGYIAVINVEDPGTHEFYVKEWAKNADGTENFNKSYRRGKSLTLTVNDYESYQDMWMEDMIRKYCSEPGMTQLDKMSALCIAFEGGTFAYTTEFKEKYPNAKCFEDTPLFKYRPNDMYKEDGGYLNFVRQEAPYFVTHCWDSYVSPAVLYKFAEKLGFTDIENLYGKYPYGSDGWTQYHWYVQINYEGNQYLFGACPPSSTNYVRDIDYLNI